MTRLAGTAAAWLGAALVALPVLAVEAEHAVEEGHGETATFLGLPTWLWMTLNLLVFWGLIIYFVGPAIKSFLDARGRSIEEGLKEARERRAEAETLRATLGQKIAELQREVDELARRAESEGRRDGEQIRTQAQRERDRLLAQARGEIDHRLAQARQELKEYTAALAAGLARERLENELSPADRKRLFEENVTRLEREAR